MQTRRVDTAVHTRAALRAVLTPVLLSVAGALLAAGGLLHPTGDPAAQLTTPTWPVAHWLLLVGLLAAVAGLAGWSRLLTGKPRTAAVVATGAAVLSLVEMVPHLLAAGEAHEVAHGGAHPLFDLHTLVGPVANAVFGLAIATLAVLLAARQGAGARVLAAVAVVGGVAFAAAAPLVTTTGVGELGVLFSGSVLIGVWLLVSGIMLGRRALLVTAPSVSATV